ncbi:glycoside hydrolase family 65 protein [Galbibacter pacificus]|uniref:Glycoside hydrolase family 65 protein n=1 Tax=Galbibacter pacificus TaxID=2996052 RepID=A0ABT6FWB9_9FLAO|nr:glycoside hydrolase family 65 protein [Galbibacter pacificus]MDG3584000.1 glycoside hydrolase family 65 protein [Galbibacter pacificus]MDG3587563.1 glycoside hydrolase family 65 protein [Galbibacter pacificus]
MNQDYIVPNEWSLIEEGFQAEKVKSSESLFSMGNGAMGQRANFEEQYSGATFQGSYIAGVYYPDKTKVGWWKNGYPEYFAKVLNAPNWIGINIEIEGVPLDLYTCKSVKDFRRELNMKEGWHKRSFKAILPNDIEIEVTATRFLSLYLDEVGAIKYNVTPINKNAEVTFIPYVDGGITNEDTNWDDAFWDVYDADTEGNFGYVVSKTNKTEFHVCTGMVSKIFLDEKQQQPTPEINKELLKTSFGYKVTAQKGQTASIEKMGGYVTSLNHQKVNLIEASMKVLQKASGLGFEALLQKQKEAWAAIWQMADITIEGDVKAQQGIRFNIFHLNQTYSGKDARLNIGPKGFTGEKYGGSTYWDTEAYCIPFYMATKDDKVARNLLAYRFNQLEKAMENAEKLGFKNGAALYPMVTMNGEECHNEWEITFEEIHRNGAMVYAIHNYTRYTGDYGYILEMGLEVMIAIARFWYQRANFSSAKNKYVVLGVTGPNEYENNVNNNWYTNYIAKWCLEYAAENIEKVKTDFEKDYNRIIDKTQLAAKEVAQWLDVATNMYFPYSEDHQVFLQQDGFLDKELITVENLPKDQRPINQKWSWDRILRSPYIKQADTLQGFYFFEDRFSKEELKRHFDFYEPFTVHESSLSPCVHSIQAAVLDRMEQAYTFYLRTSRLDLDDYNKEVHEGLHITSMAGTWMSIVEGFGGMRVREGKLTFQPRIPKQWKGFSFKVNFRGQIVKINVTQNGTAFTTDGKNDLTILLNGKETLIKANQ